MSGTLWNLLTDKPGLVVNGDGVDIPVFDLRHFPAEIELHGTEYFRFILIEGDSLSKEETIRVLGAIRSSNRKVIALFAGERDGEEKFIPYISVVGA